MAYKYKERILKVGSGWTDDDGFKHPYNWATEWSSDDLAKWGVSIQAEEDISFDNRFYNSKDVEKSLTDTLIVDNNGDPVINPITGKQEKNLGLKNFWIESTKQTARDKLNRTDWYVIRKADADEAIPSDVDTYRKAVRTAAASIETKINACSDLAAFKLLFVVPTDSDGKTTGHSPINDWPDEVS